MAENLAPAEQNDTETGTSVITCHLCYQVFTRPKILPCLHTFCAGCLENRSQQHSQELECPACHRLCALPPGGVSQLKTDLFVTGLLDNLRRDLELQEREEPPLCEACEDNQADHRCTQCEQRLCETCLQVHDNLSITRSHTVLSLQDYQRALITDPTGVTPTETCSCHDDQQVKFYCEECEMVICLECTVIDHRHGLPNHVHENLQDAAERYKTLLHLLGESLQTKLHSITSSRAMALQRYTTWRDSLLLEQRKVDQRFQEVITMVTQERERIMEGLNRCYGSKLSLLKSEITELDYGSGSISEVSNYVNMMKQFATPVQLLSTKPETTKHIQSLLDIDTESKLRDKTKVVFAADEHFPADGVMGVVQSDIYSPHCTIDNVPRQVLKGESVTLLVTTRDAAGRQVIPRHKVKARLKKPNGSSVDLEVCDNKDGTHKVVVDGQSEGKYFVSITIGQQEIVRSPVKFLVVKGLIKVIGGDGRVNLISPRGIAMNRKGEIITADRGHKRLVVIGQDGSRVKSLTFNDFEFLPCDVVVSDDNQYYSLDSGNNQVVVCDEDGNMTNCFGENEIKNPYGIAINPRNQNVYVVDYPLSRMCVRIYTRTGHYVKSFACRGKQNLPAMIAINNQGMVFVTECTNSTVQVFNEEGRFLYAFGDASPGVMHSPKGIAVDGDGHVYVGDRKRVLKYDIKGSFIDCVYSETTGLKNPGGIAILNEPSRPDKGPKKLLVVDTDNHCIKVIVE